MNDKQLLQECKDNHVWIYEGKESKDFEGVPDYEFDEFLQLMNDWRAKYSKVEIESWDSGGGFSVRPYSYFTVTAYDIAGEDELRKRLRDKKSEELRKEYEDVERCKKIDMAAIKVLQKKYPELFK